MNYHKISEQQIEGFEQQNLISNAKLVQNIIFKRQNLFSSPASPPSQLPPITNTSKTPLKQK